jgi:hypothetical protein
MFGRILAALVAAAVVLLLGLAILSISWQRRRIKAAQEAYKGLPKEVKEEVLRLIQETAKDGPSVTFLRLDHDRICDGKLELLESHVGGAPYSEAGEEWPTGSPGTFLLQVRLDDPGLAECWQSRLITVFLVDDLELVVRSYAAPSPEKFVSITPPGSPLPCVRLSSTCLPAENPPENEDEEQDVQMRFPATPARLCELVPRVTEILSPFFDKPSWLVSQILHPNVQNCNLEDFQIAYEGGDPMLIQSPHNPLCHECGRRMRFLFQFGEDTPGVKLADAAVCYIYGCDKHPDHCKGFTDFT